MRTAVERTHGAEVVQGLGGFGGVLSAKAIAAMDEPVLVASTDGVGTKVELAARTGRWRGIGHDIVNHCVNDVLVQAARPLFFLDYIAASRLDADVVADVVAVLDAAADLRRRLDALPADPALQPARLDVAAQLGGLVHPGFVAAAGAGRLPDLVRYLRAAARRLDRLPDAVAADRDRMNAIGYLEREYRARGGRAAAPAVHWMLQELRVAHFAQGLGVRGKASAKQIRRELTHTGA
ncbi:MAG: DUF3418 domain-containing protein [Solirubrobacteraceae bacterium]